MSKSKLTPQQIQRDILRLLKNNGKQAFRIKDLAKRLSYSDNDDYKLFRQVLAEMDEKRLIGRLKGQRYTHKPRPKTLEGTLIVHPKGFGFVEVEGYEEDFYVGSHNMKTGLDGDRVRVGVAAKPKGDRRREAEILDVLERKRTQTVGTFRKMGHFGFVEPDDRRLVHDIYVPRESFNGAKSDDKVVVSIDLFDDPQAKPEGRVLEVIGRADDPAVQVLALAMSMNVKANFPEAVLRESEAIPVAIPASEIALRRDLRKERIFTIDPVDAKDFDDAIHITELPNGNFEVGVHIADVSHFVRPGTALDTEGFERGTSVYLVDRVIPMLPEKLSNEVCSLRPHEDRLAYSCIMEVTPEGKVVRYEIVETVIHSKQRFSYEEAQEIIDGGDHAMAEDVRRATNLARRLTAKRMARGSIDFDLPDVRIILDESGLPIDIIRKDRIQAHRTVEELMLLANRTVAGHIGNKSNPKPFVYRIHDRPDAERIRQLSQYIRAFGHKLNFDDDGQIHPKELNQLLTAIKGTPQEPVIETATLRAMAKAIYSTNNIGHFGLAFNHYSHFTSPIRRYPDLMVHRLLKRYTAGGGAANEDELNAQCKHCSERERAAVEAERESVKMKKVEYIRQHLGEQFEGVVSGVTEFGIFIELNDLLVEGMVHVRDMDDDFYEYDPKTYSLVGEHSGQSYKPGDAVEVIVAGANTERREVDFVFVD